MSKKKPRDLSFIGRRFGRLLVTAPGAKWGWWYTRCDCGKERLLRRADLTHGQRSCGCRKGVGGLTHGASSGGKQTPEFNSWVALRKRVRRDESGYASRGIRVCKRWDSFTAFLSDVGPMPRDGVRYTIERKNNNRGYTPGNCVWATYKQQGRNKRNNHLITYKRRTQALAAWAEETGISYGALKIRLRNGWPVKLALTTPVPAPHRVDPKTGKFARGPGSVRMRYKSRRKS